MCAGCQCGMKKIASLLLCSVLVASAAFAQNATSEAEDAAQIETIKKEAVAEYKADVVERLLQEAERDAESGRGGSPTCG